MESDVIALVDGVKAIDAVFHGCDAFDEVIFSEVIQENIV